MSFKRLGVELPEGINVAEFTAKMNEKIDFVSMYQDSVRNQLAELELKDRELETLIKQEGRRSREFADYRATDQNLRAELKTVQDLWAKRLDREGEVDALVAFDVPFALEVANAAGKQHGLRDGQLRRGRRFGSCLGLASIGG